MSYKQGFAFIDYADKRDAEDAISSMNGKTLAGRTITVELSGRPPKQERVDDRAFDHRDDRADPRGTFGATGGGNSRSQGSSDIATRNLFVANIPEHLSEVDVEQYFAQYGQVQVVKFLPQKSDTRAAFVDFATIADARDAHDSINMIAGYKLRTDYNRRGQPSGSYQGGGDSSRNRRVSYDNGSMLLRFDDRPRYDDRSHYDDRPPPRYDGRVRYEERPPPPRYDDRYEPFVQRYDDRRYDDYRIQSLERERDRVYYDRPLASRYEERSRHDDRSPLLRYSDRPRYEDRTHYDDDYRR